MTNSDFIRMLSDKYYYELFQYLNRVCANKAIIADILQDTFMIASQKADKLQNHKNLSAWMYCTARYRMLQMLAETLDYEELSSISDSIADTRIYEDECIAAADLYPELSKYVNPDHLNLLIQYYEEGYTLCELAEKYHTTEASVKMKIRRAQQKLKKALKKYYIL